MAVHLSYNAEVANLVPESFFAAIASETIKRCPLAGLSSKDISLSAVAVSTQRIQELNRTYRDKNAVTDILSFGEYADTAACVADTNQVVFLGEIFFCYDVIKAAAEEDGVTLKHELAYVFSHGVLHLLGYDHSDEMFAIQDVVTEARPKE